MKKDKINELVKIFDGNLDLMLFYVTWIKNGLNASKAYKELHPDVDDHSSRTLGSRMLAKVDKRAIMDAYGLDQELYLKQLKEGNEATKWNDFTGDREADHKTRRAYHEVIGKLLGIETDKPLIQLNEMKVEIVRDENSTK